MAKQRTLSLVLFLVAFSVAFAADSCLDNSWATAPVNQLAAAAPATGSTLTDIQDIVNTIFNIFTSVTSPHAQALYVGFANNDFYEVRNCKMLENRGPECAVGHWGLAIRNTEYYGDSVLHFYEYEDGEAPSIDDEFAVGTTDSDYLTTERPWYILGSGWTELYADAITGANIRTYAKSFDGGVVGGDRVPREPCGFCLTNNEAVAIATAIAASDLSFSLSIDSMPKISQATSHLFTVYEILEPDYAFAFYWTIAATKDFYSISACSLYEPLDDDPCYGRTGYIYAIVNQLAFGDMKLHFFYSDDGTLGEEVGTSSVDFDATTRSWYIIRDEWTDAYEFFVGSMSRSFAASFNGGVVGADAGIDSPCTQTPIANAHRKKFNRQKSTSFSKAWSRTTMMEDTECLFLFLVFILGFKRQPEV